MPHYQNQERPFGRAPNFPSASSSTFSTRPHRLRITREQLQVQVPESSHTSLSSEEQERRNFSAHYQTHNQTGAPFHQRMSNPPKAPMGLDDQAAELKQKLVNSRLGRQTQANALSPTMSSAGSSQGPSVGSAPTNGASERKRGNPSPTEFVPHQLPRILTETSVEASANDITELITEMANKFDGPGKNDNAHQTNERPVNEIKNESASGDAETKVDASKTSSREEGEVSSDDGFPKPKHGQKLNMLPPKPPKPVGIQHTWQKEYKFRGAASSPIAMNNHQIPAIGRTARPHLGNTREKHQPDKHAVRSNENIDNKKDNGGGNRKAPDATTNTAMVKESITRIIDQDADLRDWLVLTNYHDAENRNKKLERHRKLQVLAKERERIEEEQRKLMEEDELEMSHRQSLPVTLLKESPVKTPATMSYSSREITPQKTIVQPEGHHATHGIPAKRPFSRGSEARPEKIARIDDYNDRRGRLLPPASVQSSPPRGPRLDIKSPGKGIVGTRHGNFDDPYSPATRHGYSPQRPGFRPQGPGPRFRMERHDERQADYENSSRQYDSYRGGGARREPSPRRGMGSGPGFSPSLGLDLGHTEETRFFMVKSFNEDNVRKCMQDGVWATQTKNGHTLTSAFANCKHVVLFFSINKSRAFQGYARMATAPSPDTPRPKWMNGIHWDTSPPFRVEWLSTIPVEFSWIGHLKNSFNESIPVLVGKDGQEIDPRCGRELLRIMRSEYEAKMNFLSGPGMSPGRGNNDNFGGREGGNVKRETEDW